MAWYDDILNKASNPLAGVGESISNLNLFGAEVPEQFTQMRDAGLLGEGAYEAAVADADKRSKRDAIIQGLLAYGSQDFNRNTGSIIPYLTKPVAVAMSAAQKPYDKLSTNAMRNIELSEFKRKQDLETDRLAMIEKLKTSPNISDEERQMLQFMTTPQVVEAIKPTTYKAPIPRKKYFTKDGVRYIQDQIFSESTGELSDVGKPRTEFKPTEYKPSNPTKTQEELIKVKLKNAFPGLSDAEVTESVGYVWDVVDKDVFTNKTPVSTSADKVIKDFINRGVLANEEKNLLNLWGALNDATLNPERIDGDSVTQQPEEVVEEKTQVVAKPSTEKEDEENIQKPKTRVLKNIVYRLGTDGKYYPTK